MKRGRFVLRLTARSVAGLVALRWLSTISSLLRKAVSPNYHVESPGALQEPLMPVNITMNGTHVPVVVTSNDSGSSSWNERIRINGTGAKVAPPRFLLGIMSHDLSEPGFSETDRRDMLRQTYLRYYRDYGAPNEVHRICGLQEIVKKQVSVLDCQIAYTFVMGQSSGILPDRTELLNAPTTLEMIRPHKEADVLSFDIKENGKFGKSPTWFRYATLLRKELGLPFDYVIKADTDTLLIPARFLRWIDKQEAKIEYQRSRIYGGMPFDRIACGYPAHDHCHNMTAPYFHGGGLYFASIDVSEYIVSDYCPRSKLFIPHEDVTMGNYVHSMTELTGKPIIGFKNLDAYHSTWKHPLKDPKRIRTLWRIYTSKKKQRIQDKMSSMLRKEAELY